MQLKEEVGKLVKLIKDTLFPAYCLGCDKEGEFVCDNCYKTLGKAGVFYCPVCHAKNNDGSCCEGCKNKISIDKHIALLPYKEDSLVGKMMHSFKYQYTEDVAFIFKKLAQDFFEQYNVEVDFIVPVPLHKRRYVERGFNQAEKIAELISKQLNKPLKKILKRNRSTKQQAKLKREERLKNLEDAFELNLKEEIDLKNKTILLVDDVFTTGSTIGECAKVLKNAGVREVVGFSVARG